MDMFIPGKTESRKSSVISHSESHPMSTRTKSADIGSKPSDTFPKKAVRGFTSLVKEHLMSSTLLKVVFGFWVS